MKLLWIVNTIFPYPARKMNLKKEVFGGWMDSLFEDLNKNKELNFAIVTVYDGEQLLKYNDRDTYYYLIPCQNRLKYSKKLFPYWKQIFNEFEPDVVHIHGTEFPIGLTCIDACPNYKYVASIQGLVSNYSKVYYANIPMKDIIKNITIRDVIKHDTIIDAKCKFEHRGDYEIETLRKCNYIIGRTNWDFSNAYAITKTNKYLKCNESLREAFYSNNWNIKNISRHTIFVSQCSYPIKGFHFVLEAISILKNDFADIKVVVAGTNILECENMKQKFKMTGYAKYLKKLIKKYDLSNNLIFTGLLNEKQMVDNLLKANVFVQASSIENSPNSLGEAMLLGVPCVASNVGGTSDMLIDKEEGFLYPYTEPAMLAYYISKVFNDDELASKIGKNAKAHALITHDRKTNTDNMLKIYRRISNEEIDRKN